MQALLASLAVSLSVKDAAYKSGMATARAEAKKTRQDFEREGSRMAGAIESSARAINRAFVGIAEQAAAMSASVTRSALALTAAVTAPILLAGRAMGGTASSFEASMNRVKAAMLGASPEQIEKLTAAAMEMGPAMGRSAEEAAAAIEALAKNGMSAAAILNGGLTSALTLATVGESDLASAADLTTDVLAQFGKLSSDLPDVVDKVSGALDVSKMGFDDYRLAIGQAGGVAGGLGVSFEEMNVALAATAATFASGSDAGTSFKTFLTSLNPSSKEAADLMSRLGMSFFTAAGAAKPLGEVAEILRQKLGNLTEQGRREALTTLFGSDGMRTAIALMNQGAAGIDKVRASIDAVTAEDKLRVLLDGDAAASARLAAESENLAIKLGSVLLPVWTTLKNAIASAAAAFAAMPGWFHAAIVVAGLFAASIGPLILAVTTLAKVALPLLLLRLGPVALGFAAVINPIGVLIRMLGQLAMQAGAATVIGTLGARMVALAGLVGLVVSILAVLVPLLMRTATASDAMAKAQDQANARSAKAAELTDRLTTATGKLREELRRKAAADALAALRAVDKAKADMLAAKAALARARAEASGQFQNMGAAGAAGSVSTSIMGRSSAAGQAQADFAASLKILSTELDTFRTTMDAYKASGGDGAAAALPTSSSAGGAKGSTGGRDARQDQDRYLDELGQLRVAHLRATADLTGGIEAQYQATIADIDQERAAFVRQIAADEALTDAKRAELLAVKDAELDVRRAIAERERFAALEQEAFDLQVAKNEAQQDIVRAEIDAADNMRARRDGELRLLDLQKEREAAELDLILATKATSSAEWENAARRREALDGIYAARAEQVKRDTETPAERYMRELKRSAAAIGEDIEAGAVSALDRLNDELADAVMGAGSLTKAFANMAQSIVRDLIRIGIQRALIAPMADMLFGATGEDGERAAGGGLLGKLTGALGGVFRPGTTPGTPGYGGGKAYGGRVSPGNWYMVGEHGPEPFIPDSAGTIVPTGGLRRPGGAKIFDLRGAVMTEQLVETLRVAASNDTDVKIVGLGKAQARAGRRRLGR